MIKFFHFDMTVLSKLDYIFRKWISISSKLYEGFSKLKHQFSLFFLANEKRNNSSTKYCNLSSWNNPFIFKFPCRMSFTFPTVNKSSDRIPQPSNQSFVRVDNNNSIVKFWTYIKGSFSINDSSKINDLTFSPHKTFSVFVSLRLIKYIRSLFKVQQQRLNGRERLKRLYVIVRTNSKDLEGGLTRLPALASKVKKVTESRQTEDELMRDRLASTASFINCTNGVNGDNPTEITRPDCDLVIRTLRGNNAYSFLTGVEGENKFGTAPVRDAYFGLGHTDMIGQLDNVTGFVQKWNY